VILSVTSYSDELVPVPLAVVTDITPVVALLGTVAVIDVLEVMENVAGTPLNCTDVAAVKLLPTITTDVPTDPDFGVKSVTLGRTTKLEELVTVPFDVTTLIGPVVALTGTLAVMSVVETTVTGVAL
jgi:hypothetical protein